MKAAPRIKKMPQETVEEECAQAEFLDDIRVSLTEMREGKVLPAAEALQLIELGLDDDELESRLSE